MTGENDSAEYVKRLAAQLVSQLPEDRRDALCALNYAREILLNLGKGWEIPSAMPSGPKRGPSIRLVAGECREDR